MSPSEAAADTERRGRGALRAGVGGEMRLTWLGLFAEPTLHTVGQNPDVATITPSNVSYEMARYSLVGAALALGATLYF